jgi:hypothetical protein
VSAPQRPVLTKRLEQFWSKRMLELEKRIVNYYRDVAADPLLSAPDGSFCMEAFKAGYYHRIREARRVDHPYEGDNLYVSPKGVKNCRACGRAVAKRIKRQKREKRLAHKA